MRFSVPGCTEAAKDGLLLAKRVLDDLGIPFWLSNGTLLGCMREHNFIPHDEDIDLGLWDTTPEHRRIVAAFLAAGFAAGGGIVDQTPSFECGSPGNGHEYTFRIPGDVPVHIDLFFYTQEPEHCWMPLWVEGLRKMIFPPISDFVEVDFLGASFRVPANWEECLRAQYGENWKTPDPEYHWSDSPKNLTRMNEEHWREFYRRSHTLDPTPFALWANLSGKTILDFGCGNGRDTYFLAEKNSVLGIDPFAPQGTLFVQTTIEEFLKTNPKADVAYCRFLFHAVPTSTQNRVLDWARMNDAQLYAEFRSRDDVPPPGHERRLIDGEAFFKELVDRGFRVTHYEEGRGLARFGDEDPLIIRIVATGHSWL